MNPGNFVLLGSPVGDIKVAMNLIEIEMPNGFIEKSTHTCYLRIPGVLNKLREAHIVPGLSHSFLISINFFAEEDASLFLKTKYARYGTAAH